MLTRLNKALHLHLIILSKRSVVMGQGVIVLLLAGLLMLLILTLPDAGAVGLFIDLFLGSSVVGIWVDLCSF
jgi:hypothetical protein